MNIVRIVQLLSLRHLADNQFIELRDAMLEPGTEQDYRETIARKLNRNMNERERERQHGSLPAVFWAEPPTDIPRYYYRDGDYLRAFNSNPINPEYATATYQTQPYVWYSGTTAASGTGSANT